jgi:hypothetical protein
MLLDHIQISAALRNFLVVYQGSRGISPGRHEQQEGEKAGKRGGGSFPHTGNHNAF